MNEYSTKKSVNELQAEINRNQTIIDMIRDGIQYENELLLREAVMNYLDGVGPGYHSEDYYASSRYYISENGIKNIRAYSNPDTVVIKVFSPKGEVLPKSITVKGIQYNIEVIYSKNYDDTIDY